MRVAIMNFEENRTEAVFFSFERYRLVLVQLTAHRSSKSGSDGDGDGDLRACDTRHGLNLMQLKLVWLTEWHNTYNPYITTCRTYGIQYTFVRSFVYVCVHSLNYHNSTHFTCIYVGYNTIFELLPWSLSPEFAFTVLCHSERPHHAIGKYYSYYKY